MCTLPRQSHSPTLPALHGALIAALLLAAAACSETASAPGSDAPAPSSPDATGIGSGGTGGTVGDDAATGDPGTGAATRSEPLPSMPSSLDPAAEGPWAVGHRTLFLTASEDRSIVVEAWYPAAGDPGTPTALVDMEIALRRAPLAAVVADARAECLRDPFGAARNAELARGRFPVALYSHCHLCTRWSGATMAERLASHGVVVLAIDHDGTSLWDDLEGTSRPPNAVTLRERADDLRLLLDVLRGEAAAPVRLVHEVQAWLAPFLQSLDIDRLATFGHNFGAGTAALVLQEDPGILGTFAVAGALDGPLAPGVDLAALGDRPRGFLVDHEDPADPEGRQQGMLAEAADAPAGSVLVEAWPLGPWGISEVLGLRPVFEWGCGDTQGLTPRAEPFTYLPPETGRDIAATAVTAFLVPLLTGTDVGDTWDALDARDGVQVTLR